MYVLFCISVLFWILAPVSAGAKIEVNFTNRGVVAESAFIDSEIGFFDRLENQKSIYGAGVYEATANANQRSLICSAWQNTEAVRSGHEISIIGNLSISCGLSELGERGYYFPRSHVWGMVTVESGFTCLLSGMGTDLDQTEARFSIREMISGEGTTYNLGPGGFDLCHFVSQPGMYEYQIILYRQYSSSEVFSDIGSLDFSFKITDEAVASEDSSWGSVKALYR